MPPWPGPSPPAADRRELLSHTVELAHLTTMAMALAQGEAGFAAFDAGMTEPPELPKAGAAGGDDTEKGPPRGEGVGRNRPLGASDRRDLERFSTMLGGYARQQPVQRVTALRGLASVGDAAAEISPSQAENVAKYLLIDKTDAEQTEIMQVLPAIRHWKRLRLAVADLVQYSRLTSDQQQQLVAGLAGSELAPETDNADGLRRMLVNSVVNDLASSAASGSSAPGDPNEVFDTAADLLAENYRQRARNFSVSGPAFQAAASPGPGSRSFGAALG